MTAQLRLGARIRRATVAVLAFASVTAWFAGVAEATPEAVSRKLAANRGFTQARVKVSSTWHASCETPLMLAADVVPELFHFSLDAKSRVRVTLGPTYPRASRRLQIVRLEDEKFVACVDAEIDVAVGQALDWTGVLEPGQYRVVVRVSRPQAAPVNLTVRLETTPLPVERYDRPLRANDIHPLKWQGDTFRSDALVKLSCAEAGAPTELFHLPVLERSTLVLWVPPEIHDEQHLYALLRRLPGGRYEELQCDYELSTVLERGSYLVVAAGIDREKAGRFLVPVKLHSLEREERVARSAPRLDIGKRRLASTRGRSDVYNFCDVRRAGHAAPDVIFRVVVEREGTLSIRVQPKGDYGGWVDILDAKLEKMAAEHCAYFPGEALEADVTPGTYFVVVDGIGINREEGGGTFEGDFSIDATLE